MNIFYENDEHTENVDYTTYDSLLNNHSELNSIMDTSSIDLVTNNIHNVNNEPEYTQLASTSEKSDSYQSFDNDQLKKLLIEWKLDFLYQTCIGNNTKTSTKTNIKIFY